MIEYFFAFLMSLVISVVMVPPVKALANRFGLVDVPNARKIHTKPLPRIGGLAVFIGFIVPFLIYFDLDRRLWGFVAGLLIIFVIGLIDDVKSLGPWTKLFWQCVAAVAVLAGGIGIVAVTNPLASGVIFLDEWRISAELFGFGFNILPIANLVSVLWIVGIINTVNFLDGMDGLAGGICIIAAVTLFFVALSPAVDNHNVALIATILAGSLLGFLIYNWHPSSIIMGDGGAYAVGLILAVATIYAGSKIAVGVLVLGVAIFDSIWAITRRLYNKKSPFSPDRGHIHHQLLDSGLTQPQVVTHLYLVAASIGVAALLFGGLTAFFVLLVMLVITVSLVRIRSAAASQ